MNAQPAALLPTLPHPPRSREAEPAARRPRNVSESTSHLSLLLPADPVRLTIIIPSRFRPCPPRSFDEIYRRATTQRFYVLTRTRCGTPECPEEVVELTGSTGNIYTVVVARQPTCDCPHALAGNQCKHVLYVLSRVLRAPFEYVYQLALLSSELREIFANAPPPPPASGEEEGGGSGDGDGRRKPVEGDCPICFCEMEAEGGEPVVWCRAACGQNIHKGCFETWAATKRRQAAGGGKAEVTCPYCRSVWEGDGDMIKKIERNGVRNAEGYVNVASQLGISTERGKSWLCFTAAPLPC